MPTLDSSEDYGLLAARLKILLPEEYRDSYEDVQPVSMGSAGLKYGEDGLVAWDEIWGSFCDLAMAGGPPHRGKLLQPATQAEIDLHPDRFGHVVNELIRGIEMVTGLAADVPPVPGWIAVDCPSTAMAGWLARAITMENVATHVDGMTLHLPAGPQFRLEKEIKNVITSIAKTCHYWLGHTSVAQHRAIADLFQVMERESPLLQTPFPTAAVEAPCDILAAEILACTGLHAAGPQYQGWLGIDCGNIRSAVWIMRLLVASNVLARREDNVLYVPVNPSADPTGEIAAGLVARVHRVACAQGIFD